MFDQDFYDKIWGTVHRHDYCPDLADRLVQDHGKGRILDLGTGCGYLVQCLRKRGCEAYGLDASEYAVANSHGNVLHGDVRDIPFRDCFFDLVHSQGLWGYFPAEDIPVAWAECLRVGRQQFHTIDYGDDDPDHRYLFQDSQEWWDRQLQLPKVLVTCPTHELKEYCFQEWIDNVKSLSYPRYDVLVVDNSPTLAYIERWGDQIPMLHVEAPQEPERAGSRMCRSMSLVQQHFLAGSYTHWMNIEADNIPPANVIELLLAYGRGADWVSHCYPVYPGSETLQQGIGCSLLSRRLMTEFDWSKADDSPDAELWNFARPLRSNGRYKTVELWGIMDVQHLK